MCVPCGLWGVLCVVQCAEKWGCVVLCAVCGGWWCVGARVLVCMRDVSRVFCVVSCVCGVVWCGVWCGACDVCGVWCVWCVVCQHGSSCACVWCVVCVVCVV